MTIPASHVACDVVAVGKIFREIVIFGLLVDYIKMAITRHVRMAMDFMKRKTYISITSGEELNGQESFCRLITAISCFKI